MSGGMQPGPGPAGQAAALLDGMAAVVTGASGGIGSAIAAALAAAGTRVLVHYHAGADAAGTVAARIRAAGGHATVAQADLRSPAEVEGLAERALAKLGRIDVWINNAGADILTGAAPRQPELDRLNQLLAVDVRGTYLCCRAVAPIMQAHGGGCIINMAWDHAAAGMAGPEAELYALAKGAVWAFSRSLARSLAPAVRVNVLAPGWIRTRFGIELDPQAAERIAASVPLARWGTPEDVAAAAVYLASPGARYLTGQAILVGGGSVML